MKNIKIKENKEIKKLTFEKGEMCMKKIIIIAGLAAFIIAGKNYVEKNGFKIPNILIPPGISDETETSDITTTDITTCTTTA